MVRNLIFNADDFGLSPGVCRGIVHACRYGTVRSTSVMVNLPDVQECLKILEMCPELDIGLHINLTFGTPVSKPADIPSLSGYNGVFSVKPRDFSGKVTSDDLHREINAQVRRAYELGLKFTHLDSHHHIHQVDNRVNEILMETAYEYKIAIRSYDDTMRKSFCEFGISTPDHFISSFFGKDYITYEMLEKLIADLPDGISEIMCHPGYIDQDLMDKSSYTGFREVELELLTNPEVFDMLKNHDVSLVSYRDICNRIT
jgi:chitin disaccharide deacetylase